MTNSINEAVAAGRVLHGRTPETEGSAFEGVFLELSGTEQSGIFVGSFDGMSAWERHRGGDELVQAIAGAATLSLLQPSGDVEEIALSAGTAVIVPQGVWHRFTAPEGVTLMTMTPRHPATDHHRAATPPNAVGL
jgi:quercetin dioxygenase-like cupin family protein